MIRDLLDVIGECIKLFITSVSWLALAIALSAVCGFLLTLACWYSSRLWNKEYHFRFRHKVACGVAGVVGFALISLFCAFGFMDRVASGILKEWQQALPQLASDVLPQRIYEAVDRVYKQPPPKPNWKTYFPLNASAEAAGLVSETTVGVVLESLRNEHPFLASITFGSSSESLSGMQAPIIENIKKMWNLNEPFKYNEVINIGYQAIIAALQDRLGRTVLIARVSLVVLFVLVQLATFGYVAISATRDISVYTYTGSTV